eukprot:RCo037318
MGCGCSSPSPPPVAYAVHPSSEEGNIPTAQAQCLTGSATAPLLPLNEACSTVTGMLQDGGFSRVLDCLEALVEPSMVLKGAKLCYSYPRDDPTFSRGVIHRLQARVRALLAGQVMPEAGVTQKELSRASLALKVFAVPPAQF